MQIKELLEKNIIIKENEFPEINQPFYKIILLPKKSLTISLNNKNNSLIPPSLLCLNEEDIININQNENQNLLVLYFNPGIINNNLTFENIKLKKSLNTYTDILDSDTFRPFYIRDNKNTGIFKITENSHKRIFEIIYKIKKTIEEKNEYWPCRTRSYLIELLFLFVEFFTSSLIKLDYPEMKKIEDIEKILNFIAENYYKKISISLLSKEFSTNRNSLNIKFKEATGLSVMEYIYHLRIHIAQSMIKETTLPISEIAYRVGYQELNNFTRMFKKLTGNPPSFFRK